MQQPQTHPQDASCSAEAACVCSQVLLQCDRHKLDQQQHVSWQAGKQASKHEQLWHPKGDATGSAAECLMQLFTEQNLDSSAPAGRALDSKKPQRHPILGAGPAHSCKQMVYEQPATSPPTSQHSTAQPATNMKFRRVTASAAVKPPCGPNPLPHVLPPVSFCLARNPQNRFISHSAPLVTTAASTACTTHTPCKATG